MSRPKLVHPDQPLPLRLVLHVYQAAASLKLAVVLINWLALTLAIGTFVEAAYGTPVAQYGVYQTWWFNALLVLLAINIFCAASIRFPWKRYQTGFVITHIGLLTLLFGTALSRMYGIDAQIFVHEFSSSPWALEENMHFDVLVHRGSSRSDAEVRRVSRNAADALDAQPIAPVEFRPGPFNWEDYGRIFTLAPLPEHMRDGRPSPLAKRICRYTSGWLFALARQSHSGDVLYDKDGIKLEVLDYYADSRQVNAPAITVAVSTPRETRIGADGKPVKTRYHWMMQDVDIVEIPRGDNYPFGASDKGRFPGGTVAFCMTDDLRRRDAFLANQPQGELGEKGQVVLLIDGQPRRVNVAQKLDQGRFDIEGTKWQAEVTDYWPAAQPVFREAAGRFEAQPMGDTRDSISPAVEVALFRGDQQAGRLLLFSEQPNLSIHDFSNRIYGDYWFDHEDKSRQQRMMHGVGNRIDILQVEEDGEYVLHYRRWDKQSIADQGQVAPGGTPESALDAFAMADQLKFYVHEHIPAARPISKTLPVAFEKDKNLGMRRPVAKVRLTVDGKSDVFWLEAYKGDPDFSPTGRSRHQVVAGNGRRVSITMPMDAVDVGFRVRLKDFERKLDPGTSQPSHYSSTVDFLDRYADRAIVRFDPESGRREQIDLPREWRRANQASRPSGVALTADGRYLYWLNQQRRTIQRLEQGQPDAKPQTVVEGVPLRPVAMAIDDENEHLYWVDYAASGDGNGRIRRAQLDGSGDQTLFSFAGRPTGIALDVAGEAVYWSYRKPARAGEENPGAIGRVDFSGENENTDLVDRMGVPSSLAVDAGGGWIYWTEPSRSAIRRARLDGSDVDRLSIPGEQKPVSIVVDSAGQRIYWADVRNPAELDDVEKAVETLERHRIWQAELDGNNAAAIVHERVDRPDGLFFHAGGKALCWTEEAVLKHNVWITMNAPVEYANPFNRQSYRLFQESFVGPFKPGSREYEEMVPSDVDARDLYASVLTVNYDPGRWIRNIGCLLIVLGIATMFYMRAYFFRPRRRSEATAASSPATSQVSQQAATETKPRKQAHAEVAS